MKLILFIFSLLTALLATSCDNAADGGVPSINVKSILVNDKPFIAGTALEVGDTVKVSLQLTDKTSPLKTFQIKVSCDGLQTSIVDIPQNLVSKSGIDNDLSDCSIYFVDGVFTADVTTQTIVKSPISDNFKLQFYLNTDDLCKTETVEFTIDTAK